MMPSPAATPPLSRRLAPAVCRLCAAALVLLPPFAAAQDLTDLPFEQLLEIDVVPAAVFAQQLTDAPSAVSVITAEDIRRFGYRTLAEILDNMRGLHMVSDGAYYFPGGRGFGKPGEYAGRLMLRIDGHPAADNVFNQVFLGEDGLIDTEMIERVEYAPGPGAALYGNNAFLGVINVVTRRGRDLDGARAALIAGSNGDRKARASWGKRLENGSEWLFSASASRIDHPAFEHWDNRLHDDERGRRLFVKGSQGGWSLEGAYARRRLDEQAAPLGSTYHLSDESAFWMLGHDADHERFRTSVRLSYGHYLYRSSYREPVPDWPRYVEDIYADGRWVGLDAKLSTVAFTGHRIIVGTELRTDYAQDQRRHRYFPRREEHDWYQSRGSGRTFSLYAQDEMALRPDLSLNLGLRIDRRSTSGTATRTNPRIALLYTGLPGTTLTLSHGTATRFASRNEETFHELPSVESERVTTTELVADHRRGDFRLLGTVYRYDITDPITRFADPAVRRTETLGAELEAEWQWRGVLLRGSHAWQLARDQDGFMQVNSPRHLSKLQASVPLVGERLRASIAARYVGRRFTTAGTSTGGYLVSDLAFTSQGVVPGLSLTAAVRNLFDRRYGEVAPGWYEDPVREGKRRTFWLGLEHAFQ